MTEETWNPEPATLREGETRDDTHASRNAEMIRNGYREGILDAETLRERGIEVPEGDDAGPPAPEKFADCSCDATEEDWKLVESPLDEDVDTAVYRCATCAATDELD